MDILWVVKKYFPIKNTSSLSLSSKDKIALLDQLSNLLGSGIPIINALTIMSYQTKKSSLKKLLLAIKESLHQWIALHDICTLYPKIFSPFDLAIIEMWELTGKMGNSIETIKEKEEKSAEIRSKILGALIYPIVIITLSMAMIMVFMVYVIPKIQAMYQDAKVNLPDLTQTIINISIFLQEYYISLIWWIIIVIMVLSFISKHPKTQIYFDRFFLHIPFFWNLMKKKILSLFATSMSILLENWVIINKALEISGHALENKYYEKRLTHINTEIAKGIELSSLMGIDTIQTGKEDFLFPIELSSVVKIGEETGSLAPLLKKVWSKFNKEIDGIIKNMQTAIEPTVIILVGWIIGTIIMAIMLPFFNMVNVM